MEERRLLVQDALTLIRALLGQPIEGIGWLFQNGTMELLGQSGDYFSGLDMQELLLQGLPEYLLTHHQPHMWAPELEEGWPGKCQFLLAPIVIDAEKDMVYQAGVLLALPEGTVLTAEQWEGIRAVTRLGGAALFRRLDLEESQRRQVRLRAVATVGREATALLNVDDLLNRVVHLISEQFGFYHVGLFLVDEEGLYAVMRATNSEGGRQLLAHNHRLKVGAQGMVGYVTGTGEPRIALDVGTDATHFVNPFLPHTRSEITLPMRHGGQVIGALDVQSTEEGAFTQDDFTTLQLMADQLANALINAGLYEELERRLGETRLLREVMLQASALNHQSVFQRALRLLRRELAMPYQAFFQEQGGVLYQTPGSNWPAGSLPVAETPWADVLAGQPLWRTAQHPFVWAGSGICTLAAAPIQENGRTVAIFAMAGPAQDHIQLKNLPFLEALAAQLSILLQNARHYEASVRGAELLRRLIQVGEQMAAARDVLVIVDIFTQAIAQENHGELEVGLLKEDGALEWVRQINPAVSTSFSVVNYLNRMGNVVLQRHLANYRLIMPQDRVTLSAIGAGMLEAMGNVPNQPYLIQPLRTSKRIVGVLALALESVEEEALQERLAWIQALSNQAALSLDNAQLLARLGEQKQELRRAYEEARHLSEIRTQMLQNVSHELRTPLSIILGYSEMMVEGVLGELNPAQMGVMQTLRTRARSLARMIQSLTTLQGYLRTEALAPVAISEMVAETVKEFHELASRQGVVFLNQIKSNLPLIIGDEERLHLALTHLIENSVKFSPDGGEVIVQTWEESGWLKVRVTDHGIGIEPQHLRYIFDPFYQADGATTRRFGGMGIGLALVWEIVEAHGGQVGVESTPGKGSSFTLQFPLPRDVLERNLAKSEESVQ